MGRLAESITRAVLRRPAVFALGSIAAMVVAALFATRMQFAGDVRALVAGADPQVERQLRALSEFTAVDQLLIQVDAAGHPTELVPAATALVDALRTSGRFDDAYFEVDAGRRTALMDVVFPRRFLLDPRDPTMVMTPDRLRQSVSVLRAMLISPAAIGRREHLMRDPIGSVAAALGRLSAAPGLPGLDASRGRLASRDGRSLLVVARPKGHPFRGVDAAATMAAVDEARRAVGEVAPNVVIRPIGAHRFAHDAEQLVRRDVHWSAGLTLVCILLIFVAFFRRPRWVIVALPPLATGALVAGGVAGLIGEPLHGIVLAFSAACLGLSIDYTIHLLAAVGGSGDDIRVALPAAARRIGGSLALAAASTVAGLAVLASSNIPALSQMAVLAAAAVTGAFVGNLIWVPILLPLLGGRATAPFSDGPWFWAVRAARANPRWVVITALVLTAALAWLARGTRFDGDLRNLDTHTPEARADEAAFATAFGDPTHGALALIEKPTVDEALRRAEEVAAILAKAGIEHVLTPTVLAPSSATAAEQRERWCPGALFYVEALGHAGAGAGFRDDAFEPFAADLDAWCGAPLADVADPTAALAAFGNLIGRPVLRRGEAGSARLVVAFEGEIALLDGARQRLANADDVVVVQRNELNERLTRLIADDAPRLAGMALAVVSLMLLIALRNIGRALRALAPCLLGGLATLGVLAALDIPIDLMNLCVFPLLAGIGIDYGVLMVGAETDPDPKAARHRSFSVTVAAATTLAAFGTLAMAEYGAIATIGRAVLIAVVSCALFALWLPPAFAALRGKSS
ncbi:MAG: MMPL family transporter [Myxococcota bacterium]